MRIRPGIRLGRVGPVGFFLTGRGGSSKGSGCAGCFSLLVGAVVLLAVIGLASVLLPFLLPLVIVAAVIGGIIFLIIFLVGFISAWRERPRETASNFALSPLGHAFQNDMRIMEDSLHFVNTSTNIETVIGRYYDLLNALSRLAAYENNPNVRFTSELPSAALARMQTDHTAIMNRAIDRAYAFEMEDASTLKTEKGRKNR